MRTRHWKMALNIVVVLAVCASLSWAQQPAVTFSYVNPVNTGDPGTGVYYGWMFRVSQDTYVTDLGLYDVGGDGLLGSWNVKLWKYVANSSVPNGWEIVPMASTTIGPISGGPAEGDCHFVPLSEPVLIQPVPVEQRTGPYDGMYFVGFYSQGGLPREYLLLPGGTVSAAPDAPLDAGYPVQAYGTVPASGPWPRPGGSSSHFGVNFKYTLEPPGPPDSPPVADAGGPYMAFATSWNGTDVMLDGSESSDPDGDSLSYAWDFDSDGDTDSTETSPTAFFACGQTQVTLTVSDGNGGTHSQTTTVTVGYRDIVVDVKPGDAQNVINMGSNGVIPVAFLTTDGFDATTIDPTTVVLRGEDFTSGLVRMRGKNGSVPQATITDIDGDGRADLLVHVETEKLADGDIAAEIELGAQTFGGEVVLGQPEMLTVLHQE
jgi:hypothetical protein